MNSLFGSVRAIAVCAFALAVTVDGVSAQGSMTLCLKNGVTVHAQRIESRSSGYFVTPPGKNVRPFVIAGDQVREIGVACTAEPLRNKPEAQPAAQGKPQAPAPIQVDVNSPRFSIQGSDVIGTRLMPLLIEAYAKKRGWSAVARPSAPDGREIELTAPGASRPSAVIDLKISDSAGGVSALVEGRAAVAMSTRRMSQDEAALMKARIGVDPLTPAAGAEHVVALDALAVIVHRDNPVKRLKLDQIAQIFSGQIANWKDVHGWDEDGGEINGNDGSISLHALGDGTDGMEFFKAMVMTPSSAAMASGAQQHAAGKKLTKAVGRDVNAIGLVEFPYVSKNDPLKIATSCGLVNELSRYSVKTEQYPLMRRLYLYTAGAPGQTAVREFIEFVLSDQAQTVARGAGLIDQDMEYQDNYEQSEWRTALTKAITLRNELKDALTAYFKYLDDYDKKKSNDTKHENTRKPKLYDDFRSFHYFAYKDMDNLRRLSATFRFEVNSSQLDARALQDLKRVAGYLKSRGEAGRYFRLTGFADASGSFTRNRVLSLERASQVLEGLAREGAIPAKKWPEGSDEAWPGPTGLSSLVPVACDDGDEGRNKNRRVEVWMYDPGAK